MGESEEETRKPSDMPGPSEGGGRKRNSQKDTRGGQSVENEDPDKEEEEEKHANEEEEDVEIISSTPPSSSSSSCSPLQLNQNERRDRGSSDRDLSSFSSMLSYKEEIVDSLMREDALAILSRGLDVHAILLLLLHRLQTSGVCTPGPLARRRGVGSLAYPKLIFLLNVSEEECELLQMRQGQLERELREREKISQALSSLERKADLLGKESPKKEDVHHLIAQEKPETHPTPPHDHNGAQHKPSSSSSSSFFSSSSSSFSSSSSSSPSSLSSSFVLRYIGSGGSSTCEGSSTWSQRQKLYARGGCFCVSSRVLVGDLLTGKLPPEVIDCLVIMHAEWACKGFHEAFIVRLYRQRNRLGGLKALCDHPSAFFSSSLSRKYHISIFGLLEKTMKQLCLQRLLLYPRTSPTLQRSLPLAYQPTTLEVLLRPSPCTLEMQQALTLLIQQGLDHLKKLRALNLEGLLSDARSIILGSRAMVASAAEQFFLHCQREDEDEEGLSHSYQREGTRGRERQGGGSAEWYPSSGGEKKTSGREGPGGGGGEGPSMMILGGLQESAEAVWNLLDEKTKQFVADLGVLKSLLWRLYRTDSVAFYRLLENVRTSRVLDPAWSTTTEMHILLNRAERRVFSIRSLTHEELARREEKRLLREKNKKAHLPKDLLQSGDSTLSPSSPLQEKIKAKEERDGSLPLHTAKDRKKNETAIVPFTSCQDEASPLLRQPTSAPTKPPRSSSSTPLPPSSPPSFSSSFSSFPSDSHKGGIHERERWRHREDWGCRRAILTLEAEAKWLWLLNFLWRCEVPDEVYTKLLAEQQPRDTNDSSSSSSSLSVGSPVDEKNKKRARKSLTRGEGDEIPGVQTPGEESKKRRKGDEEEKKENRQEKEREKEEEEAAGLGSDEVEEGMSRDSKEEHEPSRSRNVLCEERDGKKRRLSAEEILVSASEEEASDVERTEEDPHGDEEGDKGEDDIGSTDDLCSSEEDDSSIPTHKNPQHEQKLSTSSTHPLTDKRHLSSSSSSSSSSSAKIFRPRYRILFVVEDEATRRQLRLLFMLGSRRLLLSSLRRHLFSSSSPSHPSKTSSSSCNSLKPSSSSSLSSTTLSSSLPPRVGSNMAGRGEGGVCGEGVGRDERHRLLPVVSDLHANQSTGIKPARARGVRGIRGRYEGRGGRSTGGELGIATAAGGGGSAGPLGGGGQNREKFDLLRLALEEEEGRRGATIGWWKVYEEEFLSDDMMRKNIARRTRKLRIRPTPFIVSGRGSGACKVAYTLREINPHAIVLVDPQPHLVREIEVFCAERSLFKNFIHHVKERMSSLHIPSLEREGRRGRSKRSKEETEEEEGRGRDIETCGDLSGVKKIKQDRRMVGEEERKEEEKEKEEKEEERKEGEKRMGEGGVREREIQMNDTDKEEEEEERKKRRMLLEEKKEEEDVPRDVSPSAFPLNIREMPPPSTLCSSSPSSSCSSTSSSSSSSLCRQRSSLLSLPSYIFGSSDLHVFVLVLQESVEFQQYLSNIQVEQTAWKMLYQQKQHLLVPLDDLLLFSSSSTFSPSLLSFSSSASSSPPASTSASNASLSQDVEREGDDEARANERRSGKKEGEEEEMMSSWIPLLEAKREREALGKQQQPQEKIENGEKRPDQANGGGGSSASSSSIPHTHTTPHTVDRSHQEDSSSSSSLSPLSFSSHLTTAEMTAASLHLRQYIQAMGVDAHAVESSSRKGGGTGAFLRQQVLDAKRKASLQPPSSFSRSKNSLRDFSARDNTSSRRYLDHKDSTAAIRPETWLIQQAAEFLQPQVVVDMREMRSSLPFELFCKRLKVLPMTFGVGDYVLSREICVERKAVFDLWQSLLSGRLYQQAQLLCQHYRCPTLLIEFERGRPFSLAAYPGLPSDADSSRSLSSSGGGSLGCSPLIHRLVLLILHFPSLRLIWAPHSAFAANLFIALKAGREQPDPSRIEAIDQEFFLEEEVVSYHKKNSTRSSARSSTPSSSTSLQLTLAASMKKKSSSQTSQPELDCKASSTEGNRREEEDAPSEKRFRDSDRKVSDTALDVIAVEDDAEDDKKNGAKEAEGEKNRMEKTGSKILSSSSLASSQQVSGKTSSGRTSILALGDVAPLPSSKSGVCTPGGGGRTSRQRQLVLTTEGADVKASKVATSGNKSVGGWIGSSGVKIGENRERLEKTEEKERERKEEGRHVSLRPASSATNSTAVDFLRRLPGVNSKNIYLIVSKVPSIADLVAKSEKELTDLLGRDDGHHLYSFLNAPINFD